MEKKTFTFDSIENLLDWCRDNLSTKQKLFINKSSRINGNRLFTDKNIPVYQYDLFGCFVKKYNSTSEVAAEMKCPIVNIYSAIKRQSIYGGRWYFSRQDKFELPSPKKYNRNPLLRG